MSTTTTSSVALSAATPSSPSSMLLIDSSKKCSRSSAGGPGFNNLPLPSSSSHFHLPSPVAPVAPPLRTASINSSNSRQAHHLSASHNSNSRLTPSPTSLTPYERARKPMSVDKFEIDIPATTSQVQSDFICPICDRLILRAMTSKVCCHSYCESCIASWTIDSKLKFCPLAKSVGAAQQPQQQQKQQKQMQQQTGGGPHHSGRKSSATTEYQQMAETGGSSGGNKLTNNSSPAQQPTTTVVECVAKLPTQRCLRRDEQVDAIIASLFPTELQERMECDRIEKNFTFPAHSSSTAATTTSTSGHSSSSNIVRGSSIEAAVRQAVLDASKNSSPTNAAMYRQLYSHAKNSNSATDAANVAVLADLQKKESRVGSSSSSNAFQQHIQRDSENFASSSTDAVALNKPSHISSSNSRLNPIPSGSGSKRSRKKVMQPESTTAPRSPPPPPHNGEANSVDDDEDDDHRQPDAVSSNKKQKRLHADDDDDDDIPTNAAAGGSSSVNGKRTSILSSSGDENDDDDDDDDINDDDGGEDDELNWKVPKPYDPPTVWDEVDVIVDPSDDIKKTSSKKSQPPAKSPSELLLEVKLHPTTFKKLQLAKLLSPFLRKSHFLALDAGCTAADLCRIMYVRKSWCSYVGKFMEHLGWAERLGVLKRFETDCWIYFDPNKEALSATQQLAPYLQKHASAASASDAGKGEALPVYTLYYQPVLDMESMRLSLKEQNEHAQKLLLLRRSKKMGKKQRKNISTKRRSDNHDADNRQNQKHRRGKTDADDGRDDSVSDADDGSSNDNDDDDADLDIDAVDDDDDDDDAESETTTANSTSKAAAAAAKKQKKLRRVPTTKRGGVQPRQRRRKRSLFTVKRRRQQ